MTKTLQDYKEKYDDAKSALSQHSRVHSQQFMSEQNMGTMIKSPMVEEAATIDEA